MQPGRATTVDFVRLDKDPLIRAVDCAHADGPRKRVSSVGCSRLPCWTRFWPSRRASRTALPDRRPADGDETRCSHIVAAIERHSANSRKGSIRPIGWMLAMFSSRRRSSGVPPINWLSPLCITKSVLTEQRVPRASVDRAEGLVCAHGERGAIFGGLVGCRGCVRAME